MNPPHDFVGWVALIGRILLLIAPPGVLIWRLFSTIAAHSICLSGQRWGEEESTILYRFAIQNNEDVSLTGKRNLTIRILDSDGRFSKKEEPVVYAGCNPIHSSMDKDLRVWTLTFDELPAYETWTIECRMNHHTRNVSVSIEEAKRAEEEKLPKDAKDSKALLTNVPRLSHSQLTLLGDQESIFEGRHTTPGGGWAATAVAFAVGSYWSVFYIFIYPKYGIAYEDWIAPASIAVFGLLLWWLTRRPAPFIIQGYWTPSPRSRDSEQ